eukprot:Phypoly_transcript_02475.p1 GENE.Phypoly_transcript_02475~~Phypoly_transcript_02475.p1  ORF type:complete len:844 (+),score=201.48 Phypoly_transcript_02475:57-2534(+)
MASELYLTEYERERQKKIEENKRLLETLGIFETRSVLDASTLSVDETKPKRNYIKRARVQLEPRRSERVSIRPQTTSYAESDDSGTESDKPKGKGVQGLGVRKLNSYFSVRKTMWKPFYGQEIATCHICLVRNRQPKTKCSRCYADFWRGHVCRGCYEANFTGEDIESFDEARENPNWVCFVCRGICTCKFCRVGSTKRGKRYTKKRPMEEEEALALAQGQQLQIKEERDSDEGQSPFLQRKRGRGRPPKSRNGDPNQSLLMGSDPGDEDDQFDPLFEGQLDGPHYQFDQLEQLEQLQEQLSQLEQLDQLQELERAEREHEMMRQEHQLGMQDPMQHVDALAQHMHPGQMMPQVPLKRGRGRPPKNPQQQQFKRQKYHKHELHHKLHQKGGRRKSLNEYSDVLEDKHHDVHVKQESLMDDSLLGHDPSLLQYDQMLMLPEQPMLHEHILQDIPSLNEHPLQLPMLHSQSLQDISQDHGIQDQLFREHSFQQPFHNSFIHHNTHHPHHSHTHTHTTPLSMSAPAYTSHDSFVSSHAPSHFSLSNHHNHTHHNSNSILNSTTPTSLLLDNSLYQHPYFFQHYYYPSSSSQQSQQELQELQQQQMQQEQQQQELHRQEIHRQEIQRQRQELHRQELHREAIHRQEEEDLITRQHELRAHHHPAHHHPLLHTDFINQGSEPEHRSENNTSQRDILHPASILQDPSSNDDSYHHFPSQSSSLMPPYESAPREQHSPHYADSHADYLAQIHEQDSPPSSAQQGTTLPPLPGLSLASLSPSPSLSSPTLPSLPSLSSPLEPILQQFKQEYTHHDLQQREHYEPRNHSSSDQH